MVNLTITVDDDVLHRARIRAAEQRTSVNAVLREELERYAQGDAGRAADAFIAFARANAGQHVPGKRWTRDDLHMERFDHG